MENTQQEYYRGIKYLEIASKVLIVFFCAIIFYVSAFSFDYEFVCFGKSINLHIWFSLLIMAIFLETIALLLRKKYHLLIKNPIKKFLKFLLFFLIFSSLFSILFYSPCGSRAKARNAWRMAELKEIKVAQDLFYEKKSRYAISQNELAEQEYFSHVRKDINTEKEYTDRDGIGLEGGDDNPNTWEVQVELEGVYTHEYEICIYNKEKVKGLKKIYFCDKSGCKIIEK